MTARLLRVEVRPVSVIDDGENLIEVDVRPVAFSSAEWWSLDPPSWAAKGAEQITAQLNSTHRARSTYTT